MRGCEQERVDTNDQGIEKGVGGGSKLDELSDQKWNSGSGVWTGRWGLLAWAVIHEQDRALRERNSSGSGSQS